MNELEETLERKADATAAKKPNFPLNYSVERNTSKKKHSEKKTKNKSGRKLKKNKISFIGNTINIYPENCLDGPIVLFDGVVCKHTDEAVLLDILESLTK